MFLINRDHLHSHRLATVLPAETPKNEIFCFIQFLCFTALLVPKVHIIMITNLH